MKYKHKILADIAVPVNALDPDNRMYVTNGRGQIHEAYLRNSVDWVPYPEVLLVTEDKKEITDQDGIVWYVNTNTWTIGDTLVRCKYWEQLKYFSTAAARDEYVLLNKPVLSVKEVMDKYFPGEKMSTFEERIKQHAKSKL